MMTDAIIDIHNHPNWHGVDIDGLVADMDARGIARTWLLSWEIPAAEFDVSPGYHEIMDPRGLCAPLWMVVEALHTYPDRFIGGWAPDPRDRYARAKLAAAVRIHGIKVYGELKCRMRYDNPDAIAMFRFCGRFGIPVLFHLQCPPHTLERLSSDPYEWPEWHGGDMGTVETICRLCPDTQFIGHGPGFWREISAGADDDPKPYPSGPIATGGRLIDVLRAHPNLHCDLSAGSGRNALARDGDHARRFIEEFQDRCLFGRDTFDSGLMEVLDQLDLGPELRAKLLHDNAAKLIEHAGEGL